MFWFKRNRNSLTWYISWWLCCWNVASFVWLFIAKNGNYIFLPFMGNPIDRIDLPILTTFSLKTLEEPGQILPIHKIFIPSSYVDLKQNTSYITQAWVVLKLSSGLKNDGNKSSYSFVSGKISIVSDDLHRISTLSGKSILP